MNAAEPTEWPAGVPGVADVLRVWQLSVELQTHLATLPTFDFGLLREAVRSGEHVLSFLMLGLLQGVELGALNHDGGIEDFMAAHRPGPPYFSCVQGMYAVFGSALVERLAEAGVAQLPPPRGHRADPMWQLRRLRGLLLVARDVVPTAKADAFLHWYTSKAVQPGEARAAIATITGCPQEHPSFDFTALVRINKATLTVNTTRNKIVHPAVLPAAPALELLTDALELLHGVYGLGVVLRRSDDFTPAVDAWRQKLLLWYVMHDSQQPPAVPAAAPRPADTMQETQTLTGKHAGGDEEEEGGRLTKRARTENDPSQQSTAW